MNDADLQRQSAYLANEQHLQFCHRPLNATTSSQAFSYL
jgi:hypothetical protein